MDEDLDLQSCLRVFTSLKSFLLGSFFYNLLVCDSRLVYIDAFYTLQKKLTKI